MFVLGIESSCDETAASVVGWGRVVLSDVVASQIKIHSAFGGVVPELASRHHLVTITTVVAEALQRAFNQPSTPPQHLLRRLDGVAVTRGPGLVGSLMIGLQVAKGLALAGDLDLVAVNHLDAHLEAVYALTSADHFPNGISLSLLPGGSGPGASDPLPAGPPCPHVALAVSGGHTLLVRVERRGRYHVIGATRDDAAGEAFDKVAKMLGLGYPGGVVIDRLADAGDPTRFAFPRALPGRRETDFSFSGLKTAVRLHLERHGSPRSDREMADLCASVQEAIVDVLVKKTRTAVRAHQVQHLVMCGGVAANSRLRSAMNAAGHADGFIVHTPPISMCTDNAAMVAVAGSRLLMEGVKSGLAVDATARWLPEAG